MPLSPTIAVPLGRLLAPTAITEDAEFRDLVPPPTAAEREALLAALFNEGCGEALYVWPWNGRLILLVGYALYPTLRQYGSTVRVLEKPLAHRAEARQWIVRWFLGRGMLTPLALSYYRGVRYQGSKGAQGGDRKSAAYRSLGAAKTADALAEIYHVERTTIHEDAAFAAAVDRLAAAGGERIKPLLFARSSRTTKSAVKALAAAGPDEQQRGLKELVRTGQLPRSRPAGEPATMTLPRGLDALSDALIRKLGLEQAGRLAALLGQRLALRSEVADARGAG